MAEMTPREHGMAYAVECIDDPVELIDLLYHIALQMPFGDDRSAIMEIHHRMVVLLRKRAWAAR